MRHVFAFAIVAAAYGFGCSSSSTSVAEPSVDDGCTSYAANYCEKANSCVSFYIQVSWGDVALCKSRLKESCLRAAKAPSTGITGSALDKCVKTIPAVSCSDFLNGVPIADCQVTGSIDDGKVCGDNAQCKSGFCATDESKSTCGTCSPKIGEGAACAANDCPDGLKCVKSKCQKPVAAGGACSADKPCGQQLSCIGGTCQAHLTTEGAACDDKEVTAPKCDFTKNLACLGNKCQKFAFASGAGGACGITLEGTTIKSITLCDKGGYCKGVDVAKGVFTGTCAPAAADGAACVAGDGLGAGPGCIPPAKCVDGVCKISDPATCK